MKCVTDPSNFAFGIAPIKVIESIETRPNRITKCENVLGCV